MTDDARSRLRARMRPGQGGDVTLSSQGWAPLSWAGNMSGTDSRGDISGRLQGGGDVGGHRRFVYANIQGAWEEGYGTSIKVNGALSFERDFGQDALAGLTVGTEVGHSDISGEMDGSMKTAGLSFGVYGAKRLTGTIILDGYANIARLGHDLHLSDDVLTVDGSFASTALSVGMAISGETETRFGLVRPELVLEHAVSRTDRADLIAASDAGEAEVMLDELDVRVTRGKFTPELIRAIGSTGTREISIAPSVVCERLSGRRTEQGCGVGLGLGFEARVASGKGIFTADIEVEEIHGRSRGRASVDWTLRF